MRRRSWAARRRGRGRPGRCRRPPRADGSCRSPSARTARVRRRCRRARCGARRGAAASPAPPSFSPPRAGPPSASSTAPAASTRRQRRPAPPAPARNVRLPAVAARPRRRAASAGGPVRARAPRPPRARRARPGRSGRAPARRHRHRHRPGPRRIRARRRRGAPARADLHGRVRVAGREAVVDDVAPLAGVRERHRGAIDARACRSGGWRTCAALTVGRRDRHGRMDVVQRGAPVLEHRESTFHGAPGASPSGVELSSTVAQPPASAPAGSARRPVIASAAAVVWVRIRVLHRVAPEVPNPPPAA